MSQYIVTKKNQLKEMGASIESGVKKAVLMNGNWKGDYASGVVVVDSVKGRFEIHDKMRDVWYILSGRGKFSFGGNMQKTESPREGEWLSDSSEGAEIIDVEAGDIIDIPPGIPHRVETDGRMETFIVKVPA